MNQKVIETERILREMIKLEKYYEIEKESYLQLFESNENNFTESMREILFTWILEVCQEEKQTNEIYSHSINLFNRFVLNFNKSNNNKIDKSYLQLFACACMFLSSKLRSQSNQIDSIKLVEYTDNSIQLEDLLHLEMYILETLNWDIESIVSNDYLEYLIQLFSLQQFTKFQQNIQQFKKHFYALTALCSVQMKYTFYSSSKIALACLFTSLESIQINLNLIDIISTKLNSLFNEQEILEIIELKQEIDLLLLNEIKSQTKDIEINFDNDDSMLSNSSFNSNTSSFSYSSCYSCNSSSCESTPLVNNITKLNKKYKKSKKSRRLNRKSIKSCKITNKSVSFNSFNDSGCFVF